MVEMKIDWSSSMQAIINTLKYQDIGQKIYSRYIKFKKKVKF